MGMPRTERFLILRVTAITGRVRETD